MTSKTMSITAIIPIYNGKKFLREAVNSVVGQTLQPTELILVDDGSTDDSLKEIEGIKADFPIRVLTQSNAGQSSARNYGIKESKGELIALLDQDDVWYSHHLEMLAQPFHEDPDLGWAYSNVDQTDEAGHVFRAGILDFCGFQHPQTDVREMVGKNMHILPAATLISKKALFDVGMFDERLSGYEDDDLFLRLFVKGWGRKYISESLSQWRIHSNNSGAVTGFKSRRVYSQKIIEMFSSSNLFVEFSPSEIIGVRFFNETLHYYRQALYSKDYARCVYLCEDLEKYASLAPLPFKKSWKIKMFVMKMPRLFKSVIKLAKLIYGKRLTFS